MGFRLSTGTIVDATLIAAPSSTKNAKGERDLEMKQSRMGQQWYFGMKAHLGVDAKSKLIHHVAATSGAVSDGKMLASLLHGEETAVRGDSAYAGYWGSRCCSSHLFSPATSGVGADYSFWWTEASSTVRATSKQRP